MIFTATIANTGPPGDRLHHGRVAVVVVTAVAFMWSRGGSGHGGARGKNDTERALGLDQRWIPAT